MLSFPKKLGSWTGRIGRAVAVATVVLVAGGAAAWLASGNTRAPGSGGAEKKEPDTTPKIRRTGADTVVVPADVQASLGLKTAPAAIPTRPRTLPTFQGKLNFDNSNLARIQSTFAGPIIELKQITEEVPSPVSGSAPLKIRRAIKPGDQVNKDEVLAVVWSADLGGKKSDFVDAVSKLKTDEKTLERLKELYELNATAERTVRDAERTVQQSRAAVEKAEATLRANRLPTQTIEDLRADADRLSSPDAGAKRTDPAKWARVEIKAPLSGVILEQNVVAGQVVDPTVDLFRICDLSSLAVWVHLYEEDLPLLRGLELPRPWVITAAAQPGVTFHGRLERIGPSLDPAQQTVFVTGSVENPRGELRSGMAVSVGIMLKTPTGEIEVPAEAVVEDGRESFVFVRTDPSSDTFVRRSVTVVRRTRDVISVAERPDGIKPGDLVVTAGSLLLGDAFGDLPLPKP